MSLLRASLTVAAGLGLLFALVGIGHLMPWVREVQSEADLDPPSVQAGEPAEPVVVPSCKDCSHCDKQDCEPVKKEKRHKRHHED